ncbi:MAG: PQQ-binding-like beta-propeller repeat protein [Myxococcales bacterium]|nr:PQQ-binding-like beta-propeller repeat protein [Myxococcales bacterium]
MKAFDLSQLSRLRRRGPRVEARISATALGLVTVLLGGCAAMTVRRPSEPTLARQAPQGALSLAWQREVHAHELFEPSPEECSTGVVVKNRLVLGSRARDVVALSTVDGTVLWRRSVGAQIESEALHDAERNLVYVGANDGRVLALRPTNGDIVWSFQAEGGLVEAPSLANGRLFFTTNRGRLYALNADNGLWLWDYERERPEEFTIAGQASPRVHGDTLYAGFSDGFLVALEPESGEVKWARSLASASEQYVDVDTTPLIFEDTLIAGSHSGGLYGLSPDGSTVKWRLPVEGAGTGTLVDGKLFFSTPREGLYAIDPRDGHVLWRRAVPGASNLTRPRVVGPYLVFSGARTGLYVVNRDSGTLAQTFFPGRGMCAAPAVDPMAERLYVLSNGGSVYAMNVSW